MSDGYDDPYDAGHWTLMDWESFSRSSPGWIEGRAAEGEKKKVTNSVAWAGLGRGVGDAPAASRSVRMVRTGGRCPSPVSGRAYLIQQPPGRRTTTTITSGCGFWKS